MKAQHKTLVFSTLAFAAASLLFLGSAATQDSTPRPADELDYPVLLVHGLGEGPGELAFGKLEEYLENYYFDVEVMDFNNYRKNKLVNHNDAGNLGTLAAILSMEIRDVLTKYETEKVHIVAHSYGGLIVQAYLLNFGKEYSAKKGGYGDNVAKVCYIQTPFYGSTYDNETLKTLVGDTDYGPFTNTKEMMSTLELGSKWIFNMDDSLRSDNIYRSKIDAVTFISRDDEVVNELFGILSGFMWKGVTHPFYRYRIFDGRAGNYSHTRHPLSETSKKLKSLAYIENITDPNFIAVASFLDNGRNWRKVGLVNLTPNALMMVKYDKKPGFKKLDDDHVTLTLKKKAKIEEATTTKIRRGEPIIGVFNQSSRVFTFIDLVPGKYEINVQNAQKENLQQDLEIDVSETTALSYDPKENVLREGGRAIGGNLKGLFTLVELIYESNNQEALAVLLTGLNTNGFEIEFDTEGANVNTFDKGRIFVLYNANGSQDKGWNQNGSRLEIQMRGNNVANNDLKHAGKVTFLASIDKDRDGYLDNLVDDAEYKTQTKYNWALQHHWKLQVKTNELGWCIIKLWIDNYFIFDMDWSKPYYNPAPLLSFGGKRHDVDYFSPQGCKITNFVIRNIEK